MLGLNGFSSLLLDSVDAARLLVQLDERLARRVFDLERFGGFSNGYAVLLSELDQHAPGLGGNGVVVIPLLGVSFLLWNFGEHLLRLDYIGFLILNYQYTFQIEI